MITVHTILQHKGNDLYHVSPGDTVLDALRTMAEFDCGALVVLDSGRPVGMVSERDYARKVVLMGRLSKETSVREIMDENVVHVPPNLGVEQCMAIMTQRRTRHLLASDGGRILGVVSIGDVVKAVIEDHKFTIEQLEKYITG
jgi:CBS domain-containing protein